MGVRAEDVSFRQAAELLVLLLLLVYIPFILFMDPSEGGFLWGDAAYYRLAIESLAEDGDLAVGNNLPPAVLASAIDEGQISVGTSGALVPKHQLLLPFVAYPAYRLMGDKGLLAVNVACTLALMVGVLALCCNWVSLPSALGVAYLFGVATLFLPYVYNFSADLLTTALLVWGIVMVRRRRFFTAAVLLALSISAKLSSLPAAAAATLLLIREAYQARASWTALVAMVCGFMLGILPLAATDTILFGNPLETGYAHVAVAAATGGWIQQSHTAYFNRPLLRGLWDVLFSFPKGMFMSNPLLLVAFAYPARFRSRPDAFLTLLLCCAAGQVLTIAKYVYWDTSHFSNRFLMPTVALLAPHIALVLDGEARRLLKPESQ